MAEVGAGEVAGAAEFGFELVVDAVGLEGDAEDLVGFNLLDEFVVGRLGNGFRLHSVNALKEQH